MGGGDQKAIAIIQAYWGGGVVHKTIAFDRGVISPSDRVCASVAAAILEGN
jgi:hypothetical protein